MSLLLSHLWQSSAVLVVVGLLTLAFRRNGAHVRHALWMAASLKFLLPFALLTALGSYFGTAGRAHARPASAQRSQL